MQRFRFSALRQYALTGRLSIRLFYDVVVCSACFIVSVSTWQLWGSYRQEMTAIDQTFQLIRASFLPALTKSLYEMDRNQLAVQIEGMLLLPDVCSVTVVDFYDKTSLFRGTPLTQSQVVTQEFILTQIVPDKQGAGLGKLTVQINLQNIHQRLWRRAVIILLVNAGQIFLIASVIVLLTHATIIRHLVVMAHYTAHLDITTLEPPLVLQRKTPPDELAQVVQAFNDLRIRLQHDRRARAAAEDSLRDSEMRYRLLNVELEQRVRQRTAELQVINKELQNFAYVVSHDLKAPLRAISRLVQWLVDDYATALDAKGKEMAALLIGRVQRMDGLIDGILEYSRIGRIVGPSHLVDLNRLVSEVLDLLAPPPAMRVEIASLPAIVGDKTRIQQVFQNLIGNALKFMDKPQGIITIQAEEMDDAWVFSVGDNGPGIDPKYHDKIFQIFQTLHPRDEVESTGIGLSIVKKIVEFYGGTIWVKSDLGQGSTFYFTWQKADRCSAE